MDQKNINQLFQRYILVAITVWLVIVAAFLAWDIYGYTARGRHGFRS